MNARLQTQLFGPYFSSFSAHSYGYELSNEPKSDLKLPGFRFGPYSRTGSWRLLAAGVNSFAGMLVCKRLIRCRD